MQSAHAKAIIHRDLKPSNIMLTKTGHVKVMDFGLAKQIVSSGGIESQEESITAMTRSGMTLGTLAYMSPEQVRGEVVDARSDIFSFGLVLYEMLTGTHPFRKENPMETASAILHEEPKLVGAITKGIPADLEKLLSRCLRKDAERRIQHMGDVNLALLELKEDSDSARLQATPAKKARQFATVRLMAVVFVVVILIAAGWYWFSRQRPAEPETPMTAVPLTSYPGGEDTPSFSPDGTQVAFQWCTERPGVNCDIWIKQIGEEPPFRLTTDPAEDFSPAWSPDGKFIAFLRRLSPTRAELILVPQHGGRERPLVESDFAGGEEAPLPLLAWTPDSKCLVFPSVESGKAGSGLFLLSVDTLKMKRLTTAMALFDATPAISPDGRTLAYASWSGNRSEICLQRLGENYEPQGAPESIAGMENQYNFGPAWMPAGSEIVFCSGLFTSNGLWRKGLAKSAKPRKLVVASDATSAPAVSRNGNRLAYAVKNYDTNIWRVDLRDPGLKPGTPFRLIPSSRSEFCPAYSPDGKRIAFNSDRSGHHEIWVCDNDGSNATQQSSFGGGDAYGPKWSPDGRSIVFSATVGLWPCWSRDGQSIYFRSLRSGESEIWKMPVAGGEAVQITRNRGDLPQESPDGKFLYYMKGDPYPTSCSVWRMPVGGSEETEVLDSVHCHGQWAVWQRGIYFFVKPDERGDSEIRFYEFATGKTRVIQKTEREIFEWIAVSPAGRSILYTQLDQSGSDLMLVENFH